MKKKRSPQSGFDLTSLPPDLQPVATLLVYVRALGRKIATHGLDEVMMELEQEGGGLDSPPAISLAKQDVADLRQMALEARGGKKRRKKS